MTNRHSRRPSKHPSFRPLKQVQRLEAREVGHHDEIMVATGDYARVTDVRQHGGNILIETTTGEKVSCRPETMLAVRR